MQAMIDWLQFTYIPQDNQDSDPVDMDRLTPERLIIDLLGLSPSYFQLRKGLYYYKTGLEYENISVFFDGMAEGMGFHFQLSGKGCRYMETQEGFNWHSFLLHLYTFGCRFTRIDIAIDDDEILSLETIREHLEAGNVVTKFRDYSYNQSFKFGATKQKLSDTIYFGKRSSDTFMRVYNKDLESKGDIKAIRFETVLKRERAHVFVSEFLKPEHFKNLQYLVSMVINNYIRFVDEKKNNVSRSEMSQWWSQFIGTVEKLSLTSGKEDLSLEKVESWFERQVASGAKLLLETKGENYVFNMIFKGRLNSRHQRIKKQYLRKKREEMAV